MSFGRLGSLGRGFGRMGGGRGASSPYVLKDLFNRYADAANMELAVPLIGPAWHATGASLPTISSGRLQSAGTGYLASNSFVSRTPRLIRVKVGFTGGSDLTAKGMTFGASPDTPFAIQNLVHPNFGPLGAVLGIWVSGSFIALRSVTFAAPMTNDAAQQDFYLAFNNSSDGVADVVMTLVKGAEQFSVNDPRIASLLGKTVFVEPNKQADGLQAFCTEVDAKIVNDLITSISATTLNPSDKTATITLSNGNLKATCNSATAEPQVRSVDVRSSGKVHFEFTINTHAAGTTGNMAVGISSIAEHALTSYLGQDLKSWGFWPKTNGSQSYTGAVGTTLTGFNFAAGDVGAIEADFALNKVWVKNVTTASGWNNDVLANQNPATGTGGITMNSGGGAPFGITVNIEALNDAITINTGGSAFAQSPSSGFSAWL